MIGPDDETEESPLREARTNLVDDQGNVVGWILPHRARLTERAPVAQGRPNRAARRAVARLRGRGVTR